MPLINNRGIANQVSNSNQTVTGKIRYVKSIDTSGWLWVKLEPSKENVYLCEFTKVLLVKDESGRSYFSIMEGPYAKKTASLSSVNAKKCLIQIKRSLGANIIVIISGRQWVISKPRNNTGYNQLVSILNFNGDTAKITLDSDIDYEETNSNSPYFRKVRHSSPLPKGEYKILAPDYPKDTSMTSFYRNNYGGYPDLKYDSVWFPIEYAGNQNSSFVHVGHLSEGCITISQLDKWNDIYKYLISNRLDNEGKYVGILTIK
ncbi:MAG: hypothetical protein LBN41_11715 [Enterobacteriaceae bacterium]|jgi:hypothetical protein|nr:hypothetical protein [Enterobacteriaceae bacterium]